MQTVTSQDLMTLAKGSVDRFRSIARPHYQLLANDGIKSAIRQSLPRTRLYNPQYSEGSEDRYAFIIQDDEKNTPGKYLVPIHPVLAEADKETCLEFCIDYLTGCVDASLTRFKNTPQEIKDLDPVQKRDFLTALVLYYDEIETKEGFEKIERITGLRPSESFLKIYPASVEEFLMLKNQYINGDIQGKEFYKELEGIQKGYLSFPADQKVELSPSVYLRLLTRNPCYLLFLGVEAAPERPIFGPAMRYVFDDCIPLTKFIYLVDG